MNSHRVPKLSVVPHHALGNDLRNEVMALCTQAYEEDFAAYLELLSGGMHLLASIDGVLVSHLAWVERELRIDGIGPVRAAYIEAVATVPHHRRRGYATLLLRKLPSLLSEWPLAVLAPADDAFYRRLGWEMWRGPLSYVEPCGRLVPTPEEQVMIHRLPLTPATLDLDAPMSTDWRPIEVW